MEAKYKTLLQFHRSFLVKNIIWSPQFSDMLKSNGLVTEFMVKDINACSTREEQVHRLIDVIPLKGSGAFQKFLDVLMLSGHVFISDFLREDEENQKLFDVKEMYKSLPFVQRAFTEAEKKSIETYMAERIENQVLKLLWKRDNREKDKAVEAKMKQVEQSYEFEEQYKEKAVAINNLEKEINLALEDKQELKAKISALNNAHRENEAKNRDAMAVQMRYNSANDNAIEKAKQTIVSLENCIRAVHKEVELQLRKNVKDFPKDGLPNNNSNNNKNNNNDNKNNNDNNNSKDDQIGGSDLSVYKSNFGYVLGDLDTLVSRYNYLLDVKSRHDRLLEEKEYILIHFGFPQNQAEKQKNGGSSITSSDQEPSMVRAYKDFALRNDENMDKMRKQIERYDGLLEENKAKLEDLAKQKDDTSKRITQGVNTWQGAIMNVMRNQLQDLKTDARKKESMMSMQEEEMNKLKNKIADLESQLLATTASFARPDNLSVTQHGDLVDGRLSAISADSVELIPSETPKPSIKKNLPPLRSSTKPTQAYKHGGGSGSPRGTVMRSNKPHVIPSRNLTEPAKSFQTITFPIGPISAQIKPETRGRPMGSVLGDLKAMNKHHAKSFLDPKTAMNGGGSFIK